MIKVEDLFADHEISVLIREKGFTEKCFRYYQHGVLEAYYLEFTDFNTKYHNKNIISAPLWGQVIEWLAEKHNIDISIPPFYDADGRLYTAMYFLKSDGTLISDDENTFMLGEFDTKQEARRAAILHALTLI
jgi:hypothetical protein